MKRGCAIDNVLRPLSEKGQAYLSDAIQVADILAWILQQTGKARVWQTSFSISEEFLRRLHFIQRDGLVEEFSLVLDLKATNKTLTLWPFISQVVTHAYLADNHSKMILVESLSGDKVSVITSQNLTRGNRQESGFITSNREIFDSLYAQLSDLLKNKSVPLHDVFRNRVGSN